MVLMKKPVANSPLLPYLNRCNHMVISWLLNSINPDIRSSVVYMNTVRHIWEELETRYAQNNLPRLFGLRNKLSQLSQGNSSVTAYYTKFKTLMMNLSVFLQVLSVVVTSAHVT